VGTRISGILPGFSFSSQGNSNITFVFEKGPNGDIDLSQYFKVEKGNVVLAKPLRGLVSYFDLSGHFY